VLPFLFRYVDGGCALVMSAKLAGVVYPRYVSPALGIPFNCVAIQIVANLGTGSFDCYL
jgi:hypothetical protein